ncbi:MAG: tripartite tricarboxylate transporter TctB family protein [Hyphomicrobiaceae bacterium]
MSKGLRDVLFSLAMLLAAGALWLEMQKPQYEGSGPFGFGPIFFPQILLTLWVILAVLMLIRAFAVWREPAPDMAWWVFIGLAVATGLYIYLMGQIGFALSSIVFLAVVIPALGYRHPIVVPAAVVLFPLITWYAFVYLLGIPLPTSPWFARF